MALIVETWYHVACDFCGEEGPKTLLRWDEQPPRPNETSKTVPKGWNFCFFHGVKPHVPIFACPAHKDQLDHLIKSTLGKVP